MNDAVSRISKNKYVTGSDLVHDSDNKVRFFLQPLGYTMWKRFIIKIIIIIIFRE